MFSPWHPPRSQPSITKVRLQPPELAAEVRLLSSDPQQTSGQSASRTAAALLAAVALPRLWRRGQRYHGAKVRQPKLVATRSAASASSSTGSVRRQEGVVVEVETLASEEASEEDTLEEVESLASTEEPSQQTQRNGNKKRSGPHWLKDALGPMKGRRSAVSSPEVLLERFLHAVKGRGIDLYAAQEEAIVSIFDGKHVVLDTPTGSGKSLVGFAALFLALAKGQRAYYTCPTKALVSQKFFDLCEHFGPENVGMATGDVSINTRAKVVCCTAEVLASIALGGARSTSRLGCVVMDEFHYFADTERGSAWEIPLWRLPQALFVLLSGTLGANESLYRAIQDHTGRPLQLVKSVERPVPLSFIYSAATAKATLRGVVEENKHPAYVVHFSQREALEAAFDFAEDPDFEPTAEQAEALREALSGSDFSSQFGAILRKLLLRGIGVHHAGLLPRYRLLVEQLAQKGLLTILCGTDTLGVGINVPIRTVVFMRLCKFDGHDTSLLRSRAFHQIAGRAGRKGFDTEGHVIALAPEHLSFNAEMQDRVKQGLEKHPRWKRPPGSHYTHWSQRTFRKLQQSTPEPLRSHFRLTLDQVWTVLTGEAVKGKNGTDALNDLIACSRLTAWQKVLLRRQVRTYVKVLEDAGLLAFNASQPSGNQASRVEGGVSPAGSSEGGEAHHDQPAGNGVEASENLPAIPVMADDTTLYLIEAIPILAEHVAPDDMPLAIVAGVEAMCPAPTALLRVLQPRGRGSKSDRHDVNAFMGCPVELQSLLYRSFAAYRSRHPWVPVDKMAPKGVVLTMVAEDLSFVELMDLLCSYSSESSSQGSKQLKFNPVVVAEGAVFRYVLDVYRTLRYCIPPSVKTEKVLELEAKLRNALTAVDSSVLREWEVLKALEQAEKVDPEAVKSAAVDAMASEVTEVAPLALAGHEPSSDDADVLRQRVEEVRARLADSDAEAARLAAQPIGKLRQRLRGAAEVSSRVLEGVLDRLLWMW